MVMVANCIGHLCLAIDSVVYLTTKTLMQNYCAVHAVKTIPEKVIYFVVLLSFRNEKILLRIT